MAVIGIVTCEILELEFAELLGTDVELGRVSVLEDRWSAYLLERLEARPVRDLRRLPHLHAFHADPSQPIEALLRVLALGLHRTRAVLGRALSRAAQELRPHVDAFLLGYGLCGGALADPRALLDVDLPVLLPMDHGHPVDDCVALCLGGREGYYTEQRRAAGTFFLTPGWSRHWKRMLGSSADQVTQPGLDRILAGYERALSVPTPAMPRDELLRRAAEFCGQTGLRMEVREGTMDPLAAAWAAAKHVVRPKAVDDETEGSR